LSRARPAEWDGRILAVLMATVALAGCTVVPYRYVVLTSDNVAVADAGKPPVGSGRGDIPIRYSLKDPGVSLSLTLPSGPDPSFKIRSSAPITAVSIEPGHVTSESPFGFVIRDSPFEYTVIWRLTDGEASAVGRPVQVTINLDGRDEPLLIYGVVAEAGKVRYGIGL
jgi:hypothetical protein